MMQVVGKYMCKFSTQTKANHKPNYFVAVCGFVFHCA